LGTKLPFGISACLIARDEQALIGRCLESLVELDQVVVADTGSNDKTAAVAAGMGAEVVRLGRHEPFHFGEARQAALDRAGFLWILSIDVDEILLPGGAARLRQLAADFKTHAWEIGFIQRSRHDDPAPIRMRLKRFFRKDMHRWQLRVHEQVVGRWARMGQVGSLQPPILEHLPAKDREKRKDQNFELLKLAVAESPECPRLHFYLADEWRTREDFEKAVAEIDRYLAAADEGPLWRSEAELFRGMMLGRLGRNDEALRALERAARSCPDRREPLIHAAEIELALGRPGAALWHLDRALAIGDERKPDFHLNWPSAWGKMPYRAVSGILEAAERADPAFWEKLPESEAKRLRELSDVATEVKP